MAAENAASEGTPLSKIEGLSDGGIAARHPERRVHLQLAPSFEVDETFNSVRATLSPMACWRLDSVRFGFDASFIHAEAREEFVALAALATELEGAPLSIFGHADSTNTDDYNKHLSSRRAEAVYAVLTRRTDIWERLHESPYGGDDWRKQRVVGAMLTALGYEAASVDEVKRFQSEHDCTADGEVGPQTRGALFEAYMDLLCTEVEGATPFRVEAARFLGQGTNADGKGDYQACSDFNPAVVFSSDEENEFKKGENKQKRDNAHAPSRRIVVYFFRPGTVIAVDRWPCPTAKEDAAACKKRFWSDADTRRKPGTERRTFAKHRNTFACRFYHGLAMRSPCERLGGTQRVTFKLVDYMGYKLEYAPCFVIVESGYRDAVSDGEGLVSTVMPEGPPMVMMPSGQFVRFDEAYPYYENDPVSNLREGSSPPAPRSEDSRYDGEDLLEALFSSSGKT
ncbi:OmpA family protein [Pendulispora rubella]|uniref:OmpA family protein n=1 Tax=Pendulispora rubella TaxID=2741070 RepID=A0ABZ2KVX4_9BACT